VQNLFNESLNVDTSNDSFFQEQSNLSSLHPSIINWIGEHTDQLIVILNEQGEFQFISKSVYTLLNYQPNELFSKHISHVVTKKNILEIQELIKNSPSKFVKYTMNIFTKDGHSRILNCKIKVMKIDRENFYVCYLHDITNQKQLEDLVIRSEKMSVAGQVAAGIAHEIRNPLTSLKGFIQLLQAGIEHRETYYKILLNEIKKIETITSELLYISKPLTNEKSYQSINRIITDVVILLDPQAKLRDVNIKWNQAEDISLYCNETQMKQVLINLIKNAIEASSSKDKITIVATRKLNTLVIEIVDEGEGIPQKFLHKLNEPFFTTKKDGTGLGLMVTKNLLHEHGAKLKVYRNEKKGTTFRIFIPL